MMSTYTTTLLLLATWMTVCLVTTCSPLQCNKTVQVDNLAISFHNSSGTNWMDAERHCQNLTGHLIDQFNASLCSPPWDSSVREVWSSVTKQLDANSQFRDIMNNNQYPQFVIPSSLGRTCSGFDVQQSTTRTALHCRTPLDNYICVKKKDPSRRYINQVCGNSTYYYHTIAFDNTHAEQACKREPIYGQPMSFNDRTERRCAIDFLTNDTTLVNNNVSSIPVYTRDSTGAGRCQFLDASSGLNVSMDCSTSIKPVVCVSAICKGIWNQDNHTDSRGIRVCVCQRGTAEELGKRGSDCVPVGKLLIDAGLAADVSTTLVTYTLHNSSGNSTWNTSRLEETSVNSSARIADVHGLGTYIVHGRTNNTAAVVFVRTVDLLPEDVTGLLRRAGRNLPNVVTSAYYSNSSSIFTFMLPLPQGLSAYYRPDNCSDMPGECDDEKAFTNGSVLAHGRYELAFLVTGGLLPRIWIPFQSVAHPDPSRSQTETTVTSTVTSGAATPTGTAVNESAVTTETNASQQITAPVNLLGLLAGLVVMILLM